MSNSEQTSTNNPTTRRPDRRTNRTRRALREALLALIQVKGYDTITIEEITERADLGRTTFYLHYKDKEELLMETIDAMTEAVLLHVTQFPLAAWNIRLTGEEEVNLENNPVYLIFEHVARNAGLYRMLLRGESGPKVMQRWHDIINRAVAELLEQKMAQENIQMQPQVPLEVFSNYLGGSMLGIVTWWLDHEMPYTPTRMASMYQKMLYQGAIEILGITEAK